MGNPFSLSFGKKPGEYISRITQTNEVLETFQDDEPSNQVYMITGARGTGKTVMMTSIAEELRRDKRWIVVELNPERDMLQKLAADLYAIPEMHALFIKAKLDFSALGLGVSIENAAPVTDIEVALDKMLSHVQKAGKRLLITVDEVTNSSNIKIFSAAFQIFLRKDYPVFLIMTGLYENIYDLQNEKSLTFLYRAPKVNLEPLNYTAIVARYKGVFDISQDKAEEMAKLTKGYSYAFQVLGYLVWQNRDKELQDIIPEYDQYLEEYVYAKIWDELSEKDRSVVKEMCLSGHTNVTEIRNALGMTTPEFSVYRDRLKRKGLINANQRGYIFLILPRLEAFVKMRI